MLTLKCWTTDTSLTYRLFQMKTYYKSGVLKWTSPVWDWELPSLLLPAISLLTLWYLGRPVHFKPCFSSTTHILLMPDTTEHVYTVMCRLILHLYSKSTFAKMEAHARGQRQWKGEWKQCVLEPCFSNFQVHKNQSEILLKMQILIQVDLERGLRFCTPTKLPGDTDSQTRPCEATGCARRLGKAPRDGGITQSFSLPQHSGNHQLFSPPLLL